MSHVQIKLRPSEIQLKNIHAAAEKLQCTHELLFQEIGSNEGPLAKILELLMMYLREEFPHGKKQVIYITDTIYQMSSKIEKNLIELSQNGISLSFLIMVGAGSGHQVAQLARGWSLIEKKCFSNLNVEIVELAGSSAAYALARGLMRLAFPIPAKLVTVKFNLPLWGNIKSLTLHAYPQAETIAVQADYIPTCCCHGAIVSRGSETSMGRKMYSLNDTSHHEFSCSVTQRKLQKDEYELDSGIIDLGNLSGFLDLKNLQSKSIHDNGMKIQTTEDIVSSISAECQGLHEKGEENRSDGEKSNGIQFKVLSRIYTKGLNAGMLIGPAVVMHYPSFIPSDQEDINASECGSHLCSSAEPSKEIQKQLLGAIVSFLQSNFQALVCSTTEDLENFDSQGVVLPLGFTRHYILLPAIAGNDGNVPAFCALRIASLEEIVSLPHELNDNGNQRVEIPQEITESVNGGLARINLEENSPSKGGLGLGLMHYSSKCHEIISRLCKLSTFDTLGDSNQVDRPSEFTFGTETGVCDARKKFDSVFSEETQERKTVKQRGRRRGSLRTR